MLNDLVISGFHNRNRCIRYLQGLRTHVNHDTFRARRSLLSSLAISLVLSSAFLATAWYLSEARSGFDITTFSQSVLQYAPTGVMLILIAAWRQVDYGCKLSAPWIDLQRGNSPSSKSVLLDYISSFQLMGLFNAFQNGHIAVALSILGFISLKLATVASTGLLVLGAKTVTTRQNVTLESFFDGTLFNVSDFASLQDQLPVFTTYAHLAASLDYPFGTSSDTVYSTFASDSDSDVSFTYSTSAMFPQLRCQPVNTSIGLVPVNSSDIDPEHQIQIPYPNCVVSSRKIHALNPSRYVCPTRQLSGSVHEVKCTNATGTAELWQLLTMVDMRYSQTINGTATLGTSASTQILSSSTTVANVTSIMCQLMYSTAEVNVSGVGYPPSTVVIKQTSVPIQDGLTGLNGTDLLKMVDRAVSAASDMFGSTLDNSFATEYPDTLFKLMAQQGPNQTYENLLDENVLLTVAQATFKQLSVQVADRYLRRAANNSSSATMYTSAGALRITESSAWIIFGAFVFTALVSTLLLYLRSAEHAGPANGTILGIATVVRESHSVRSLLESTSTYDEAQAQKYLINHDFCATYGSDGSTLAINAIHVRTLLLTSPETTEPSTSQWWKQITLSYYFLGTTFAYAMTTIILLEVLQRISDTNEGLVAVSAQSELGETTITHYAPTIAMTLLATMFNCLDFNVLLLHPYYRMMSSLSSIDMSQRPPLQRLPIISYWRALCRLDYPIIGSSSAAFAGAMLTIVVSGLYTIETVATPRTLQVSALDIMVPNWNDSVSDDGGAAILLSLHENVNLSYAPGTYEEVFYLIVEAPRILDGLSPGSHDNQILEVKMPAYRSNLTCELATAGEFNVSISRNRIQQSVTIASSYPLPQDCLLGGPGGNSTQLDFTQTFVFPLNATETFLGKLLDLHVGPYDSVQGTSAGELAQLGANPDNPPGCPSLALIYGYLSSEELSQKTSTGQMVAVQVCYQELTKVTINATFAGAQAIVPKGDPSITVDEASAQMIMVPTTSSDNVISDQPQTAFQFRIQPHFDDSVSLFNNTSNQFSTGSGGVRTVDRFFQGIFFGRFPVPLDTMKLANNTDFDIMQKSILSIYRRYMAQVMALKMSVRVLDASPEVIAAHEKDLLLTGNLKSGGGASEKRLVQHKTPKIILQCLIAFMILGGSLAVSTMKLIDLLPSHGNPCTIWGQMGLWSKSQWCSEAGRSAETESLAVKDGDDARSKVLISETPLDKDGTNMFRLGWWARRRGESNFERWYGIDVIPRS